MFLKYLKAFGIFLLSIIIPIFILTIINYFELFSNNFISLLKFIVIIVSMFINSFYLGKNSKSKGYIEGLKFGIIFIIFTLLYNLLFIGDFSFKLLIYYIIILFTSMFGSMVGINTKKKNS